MIKYGTTSLTTIRKRAKDARDDGYYQRLYGLRLFGAGYYQSQELSDYLSSPTFSGAGDLPDYPDVMPPLNVQGSQNHTLVNARINIQNVVSSAPQFVPQVENPKIKEFITAYLNDRWEMGDWGTVWEDVGMDVEFAGVGFARAGLGSLGEVTWNRVDVLDVLWDPFHRAPKNWEYFFIRDRLSVEEAVHRYGPALRMAGMSEEDTEDWFQNRTSRCTTSRSGLGGSSSTNELECVVTWEYWDGNTFCVFIKSIQEGDVFYWDTQTGFVKADVPVPELVDTGEWKNPYGVIPISIWIDSTTPGVKRPTAKAETSIRQASMLNTVERHMTRIIRTMPVLSVLSTYGIQDDALITKLSECGSIDDIADLLVTEQPNLADILKRVPGGEFPVSLIQFRNILKDELNASTGVMDAQRGGTVPGEPRSATEIRTMNAMQGVQAKHLRNKYVEFLKQVATITLFIGSNFDTCDHPISMSNGMLDPKRYPLELFLSYPCRVLVDEASLQYMSEDEKANRAAQKYQMIDKDAIALGVKDPRAVFEAIDRAFSQDTSTQYLKTPVPAGPMAMNTPPQAGEVPYDRQSEPIQPA